MTLSALDQVVAQLHRRVATGGARLRYGVPGLWLDPDGPVAERPVLPEAFFLGRIQAILAASQSASAGLVSNQAGPGEWGRDAVAYNLFVRTGAAWDHDGDGQISVEPLADGWRETGTFLKAITLLPFIRSLGCNTIHLLPVTAIGHDGHKGNLGSPFAIRDPYALDETLAEPALGLGAEVEFAAFVEAAHRPGHPRGDWSSSSAPPPRTPPGPGSIPSGSTGSAPTCPTASRAQARGDLRRAASSQPHELKHIYRQVATGVYADCSRRMRSTAACSRRPRRETPSTWPKTAAGAASPCRSRHRPASVTVRIPGAFCRLDARLRAAAVDRCHLSAALRPPRFQLHRLQHGAHV